MPAIAQSDYTKAAANAPETQAHTAVSMMTKPDQRASPPNPSVTDFDDFKYIFTASVRPRT